MRKIKTDKSTQSICNTLAYPNAESAKKNADFAKKKINIKKEKIIYEFDNLNMVIYAPLAYVPKTNNGLGKILSYIFGEIPFNESGVPKAEEVRIPVKDFAKNGVYSRTSSAVRGLENAAEVLGYIGVKIYKPNEFNKEEMEGFSYRTDLLFSGFRVSTDKKELVVVINKNAPWRLFRNQYINVPDEWFALSSRSFDLLQNIAMVVRRSATTIANAGYIDIDLREVAFWMGLPDSSDTRNSGKLIKQPINNAVEEANSVRSDFIIEPHYDVNRPVSDFLDRGFIRVYIDGKTKADLEIIARKRKSAQRT